MRYQSADSSFPKKKESHRLRIILIIALVLSVILFLVNPLGFFRRLFLQPVSVLSQIVGPGGVNQTDGRSNLLILGLDRRNQKDKGLTDTMIVASLSVRTGELILISLPRDLWIKSFSAKLNAAYALGGISLSEKIISEILGLPIHNYIIIDFNGFKKAIDAISGIVVDVETEFEDFRYPIPGKENDDCAGALQPECRYEKLHFEKGLQTMDGQAALKFARSRQSTGREGSDFARDARQQKVTKAFIDKALSLETLINPSRIKDLYMTYLSSVETDVSLSDAERIYSLSKKLKSASFKAYVIDKGLNGETLLYNPSDFGDYGGQWVLLPRAGDFSEVRSFTQKVVFGQ